MSRAIGEGISAGSIELSLPLGSTHHNYNKRRYGPAGRINTLDHYNLFPITRLHYLNLSTLFRTCHNYYGRDLAHHKPSLVKVPNVIVIDPILSYHVSYEVKPALNYY